MKKPEGTHFCCGVPYPQPQCEDCPMRAWDLGEAKTYALGIVADHNQRDPKLAGKLSAPAEGLLNLVKAFLAFVHRHSEK